MYPLIAKHALMVSHQGLQLPLYLEVKSDLLVMSKISQVKSLKSWGGGEQSYIRILSVASKCEHEKKTGSNKCQTWCVLPPNIWSLTAVKANCRAKCKLFVCFWSAHFAHILFFLTFRHISRSETCTLASRNHSWRPKILAKNILLSKNKSSWQPPPTPNFECLAAKHWYLHPITTRLGATDSKRPCKLE